MKFKNSFSDYKRINCPIGSPIQNVYKQVVDDNGHKCLIVEGKTNLQEHIDSYEESTNLKNILNRFEATGDTTLLHKTNGQFFDAIEMPKDFRQYHDIMIKAKEMYDNLDPRVKKSTSFESFKEFLIDGMSNSAMVPQSEDNSKVKADLDPNKSPELNEINKEGVNYE